MNSGFLGMVIVSIAQIGGFWRFCVGVLTATLRFGWHVGLSGTQRHRAARGRLWRQMHEIGVQSVPVVMVTGAFVGMTLAVQGFATFEGMAMV